MQPAVVAASQPEAPAGWRRQRAAGSWRHEPRSRLSTWASRTRAGSNGSSLRAARTRARQMAIIRIGATTSRATASLSCGRNSPAATPRRCRLAISARPRSATVGLVEAGERRELVQFADQQARQHHEPPVADDRRQHAARPAAASGATGPVCAAAIASARSRLGTISVRTSASNTASLLGK